MQDIESEIAFVIVEQTNLKCSDVTVMVSAAADAEKKGNYILSCAVILSHKA